MMKQVINLATALLVSGLAIDILYLYYAGGWVEPNTIIRITEIVLLYLIGIFGIGWAIALRKGIK